MTYIAGMCTVAQALHLLVLGEYSALWGECELYGALVLLEVVGYTFVRIIIIPLVTSNYM